jgi:hypothetical protein
MKKFVSFLFLLLISSPFLRPVSAQTSSIEGSYRVQGTNPGGKGSYHGIADIVKAGRVIVFIGRWVRFMRGAGN